MLPQGGHETAQCRCWSAGPYKETSPEKANDAMGHCLRDSHDVETPLNCFHSATESTSTHDHSRDGQTKTGSGSKGNEEVRKRRKRDRVGLVLRRMWPGAFIVVGIAGLGERIYELVELAGAL